MNELMLGIILLFALIGIIGIGIILAKGSQEHIDYQNYLIRYEREHQKWLRGDRK
jgi:hypothetical protein